MNIHYIDIANLLLDILVIENLFIVVSLPSKETVVVIVETCLFRLAYGKIVN